MWSGFGSLFELLESVSVYAYNGVQQIVVFFNSFFNTVVRGLFFLVTAPLNFLSFLFSLLGNTSLAEAMSYMFNAVAIGVNPANPLIGVMGMALLGITGYVLLKFIKGFVGGWI